MNYQKGPFYLSMLVLALLLVFGGFMAYRLGTAPEAEAHAQPEQSQTAQAPASSAPATNAAPANTANGNGEPASATQSAQNEATSHSNGEPVANGTAEPSASSGGAAAAGGSGDASAGKEVFASNCAGCHGADAKGQVGPNLTTADGPKAWDDAAFLTAIRAGKTPEKTLQPMMPRFTEAQVSDKQAADVHAFIKSLN